MSNNIQINTDATIIREGFPNGDAGALLDDDSATRHVLGVAGTLASGGFLYLIGIINLDALIGMWGIFRAMRAGRTW